MFVCGIDPGKTGAIVVLNEEKNIVHTVIFDRMHDSSIYDFILDLQQRFGLLKTFKEDFKPYGVDTKTAFTVGRIHGAIDYACAQLSIPIEIVAPKDWQLHMCSKEDKNLKPKIRIGLAAERHFPGYQFIPFGQKKPHSGMMDASLIALYGWDKFVSETTGGPRSY